MNLTESPPPEQSGRTLSPEERAELDAFERAAAALVDGALIGAESSGLHPVRLLDVRARPLRHAVETLLLAGDINAIVGETGHQKSTIALHVLAATTIGAPVFNALPVLTPGSVLLASGEDDRHVIRNRVEAMCAGHGWKADRVLGAFHVWDEGVALDDLEWEARIIAAIRAEAVTLLALDPLRDVAGASIEENSNSDAARINAVLRRIIRATGVTILYCGHVSKPAEGKSKANRFRGASAWLNATRLAWWAENADGGLTLTPLKGNRSGRLSTIRLKSIIASPDGLNWQAARFDLDTAGDVTGLDVVRVLELVGSAVAPPNSRALRTLLGVGNERSDAAISEAGRKGWMEWAAGPRGAHLWTLTDAGQARLLLSRGTVPDRATTVPGTVALPLETCVPSVPPLIGGTVAHSREAA